MRILQSGGRMQRRRNLLAAGVVLLVLFVLYRSSRDERRFPPPWPPSRPPPSPPPPASHHDQHDSSTNGANPETHALTSPPPPPPPKDVAALFKDWSATDRPLMPQRDPLCDRLPSNDRIVLIVKTGATEAWSKLPTQLQTILRCAPDLLIFSDLEQSLGGVHIRDSLDTVRDDVKRHSDFDLYRAQKACRVGQADCTRHRDGREGWNLDKYKNIHIAEKAYALRPGKDWYVVIDADTYLFWTTLVAFLGLIDPTRKLLLGSIAFNKDFGFAHGGSGYVISRGAMDDFVGRNPGIGNAYDKRVMEECCGDWMFSKAMMETSNISVTQSFPTINGDKVWSMSFGPTHWCQPLATMHHVDSEEMSLFWEFEMRRYLDSHSPRDQAPRPVLIRDMYVEYFVPRMTTSREDWTNVSEDRLYTGREPEGDEAGRMVPLAKQTKPEKVAHLSAENCRKACESLRDCFQYQYWAADQKCYVAWSFKIGYPMKPELDATKRPTAGWLTERILAWVDRQGECKGPVWPEVVPRKWGFLSRG